MSERMMCKDCGKSWWIHDDIPLILQVPYPHTWNFDKDADEFPIRELDAEEQHERSAEQARHEDR